MVQLKLSSGSLLFAITAFVSLSHVRAAPMYMPLQKRIAQVIADSTTQWETACTAAGSGQQCNPISVTAFTTLLAAAGPCEQQDAADSMIDLAKQLNNDPDMIKFAQIFAQQPRNTPTSQSVPYCQQAPKNPELNGAFQCQFQSADKQTFVGGATVGSAGTIPFGLNAPVSPAGSCPANPNGPIADGSQLVDVTQNPGAVGAGGNGGGSGSGGNGNGSSSGNGDQSDDGEDNDGGDDDSNDGGDGNDDNDGGDDGNDDGGDDGNGDGDNNSNSSSCPPTPAPTATSDPVSTPVTPTAAPSSDSGSGSSSSSGGFQLQNGQDAQALNAQFANLSADSSCNDGDEACISGGFAQCVNGKFVITQCGSGLTCAALPLVNSPGTSITCTTVADANARIAATGAQGDLTGN